MAFVRAVMVVDPIRSSSFMSGSLEMVEMDAGLLLVGSLAGAKYQPSR